jgi:hypothetical protein
MLVAGNTEPTVLQTAHLSALCRCPPGSKPQVAEWAGHFEGSVSYMGRDSSEFGNPALAQASRILKRNGWLKEHGSRGSEQR